MAGMAALLHLKVVRNSEEGSKDVDELLFSDVALGQAKVKDATMYIARVLTRS